MERRSLVKMGVLKSMGAGVLPVHAQVRKIRMLESGGASADSVEAACPDVLVLFEGRVSSV